MSNLTSSSGEASGSSENRGDDFAGQAIQQPMSRATASDQQQQQPVKRKRNLAGTPDPDAEVIALSPKTLMATNRFICEICNKGFQRDQNLQLHRRGHNLPWKLRQRTSKEIRKRVYICPEATCVHHDPARALGDLTGIKKHFCRKHGEKKWKCDKCSKRYAVQSDWKAHLKSCGTREYRCDCGTVFSRRDSFITHRAFCDALAEESARVSAHRQGGSQQPEDPPETALNGQTGGLSMRTPSSSQAANSQLSGGLTEALTSSEVSKPEGMPNLPSTEGGSSSKWIQGSRLSDSSSVTATTKGSGLSLWLGTGPGPGPPGALQMMGAADSGPPFMPGTNDARVSGMTNSEEFDAVHHHKLANDVLPSSTSAMGVFANLLASTNGYSRSQGVARNTGNDMPGMSSFAGLMNNLERAGRTMSGFGPSASLSSLRGGTGSGGSSVLNHHHHSASAQMSATALLQKGAQMGATASNLSLFRGFGLGAGDPSSIARGETRQQEQGRAGFANVFSSSPSSYPLMRRSEDLSSSNGGTQNSLGASILGQGRCNDRSSVQELMNSLSGGAEMFGGGGLGHIPSLLAPSNGVKEYLQHTNGLLNHHLLGEKTQDSRFSRMHGKPHFQVGTSQAGFGGPQRSEDGSDRPTLDFLGVGGPSGMAGATAGMGRTLSQKDLASITSLNTAMKMEPFNYQSNNLPPLGARDHSPGKSWDGS